MILHILHNDKNNKSTDFPYVLFNILHYIVYISVSYELFVKMPRYKPDRSI